MFVNNNSFSGVVQCGGLINQIKQWHKLIGHLKIYAVKWQSNRPFSKKMKNYFFHGPIPIPRSLSNYIKFLSRVNIISCLNFQWSLIICIWVMSFLWSSKMWHNRYLRKHWVIYVYRAVTSFFKRGVPI